MFLACSGPAVRLCPAIPVGWGWDEQPFINPGECRMDAAFSSFEDRQDRRGGFPPQKLVAPGQALARPGWRLGLPQFW